MKPPTKLALTLAARIQKLCGVTVAPRIHRTGAGPRQREAGAWRWYMVAENCWVGSPHKATSIAETAGFLEFSSRPSDRDLSGTEDIEIRIGAS